MTLPNDKNARKALPMARGLLDYFPDALAEVAHVSQVGNDQHNPGEELHWAKDKSQDHADALIRHLTERGKVDSDGLRHSGKVAWRALAALQIELDKEAKMEMPVATISPKPKPDRIWSELKQDTLRTHRNTLITSGCTPEVAAQIIDGMTFPGLYSLKGRQRQSIVYIAGPMRGYIDHNFTSFDNCRDDCLNKGYIVISPADIDRAAGDAEDDKDISQPRNAAIQRRYAYRDFHAIHSLTAEQGDGIVMLPDWETSVGATAELFMARWLQLNVFYKVADRPLTERDLQGDRIISSLSYYLGASKTWQ